MTSIPAVFKRLHVLKYVDSRISLFPIHYEMALCIQGNMFLVGKPVCTCHRISREMKLIIAEKYSAIGVLLNVGKSFLRTTFP